jgi:hypothetical protein
MVRVKVRRDNEEPSTQRRTKARHDPAALRAVQEALGMKVLSAALDQGEVILLPPMPKGVKKR